MVHFDAIFSFNFYVSVDILPLNAASGLVKLNPIYQIGLYPIEIIENLVSYTICEIALRPRVT